jgi:hypothetical protein
MVFQVVKHLLKNVQLQYKGLMGSMVAMVTTSFMSGMVTAIVQQQIVMLETKTMKQVGMGNSSHSLTLLKICADQMTQSVEQMVMTAMVHAMNHKNVQMGINQWWTGTLVSFVVIHLDATSTSITINAKMTNQSVEHTVMTAMVHATNHKNVQMGINQWWTGTLVSFVVIHLVAKSNTLRI